MCVYNAIIHFPPETKATFSLKTVRTSAALIPSFLRDPDEKDGTEREGKKRREKRDIKVIYRLRAVTTTDKEGNTPASVFRRVNENREVFFT